MNFQLAFKSPGTFSTLNTARFGIDFIFSQTLECRSRDDLENVLPHIPQGNNADSPTMSF